MTNPLPFKVCDDTLHDNGDFGFCLTLSSCTLSLRLIPSILRSIARLVCLRFFLLMWRFLDRKLGLAVCKLRIPYVSDLWSFILESLNRYTILELSKSRPGQNYSTANLRHLIFLSKLYCVSKAQGICTDLRFLLFGFEFPNDLLLGSLF